MRILIASPARAAEPWQLEVFKNYYESLLKQQICPIHEVDRFFIVHDSPQIEDYLKGKWCPHISANAACKYTLDENTHNWTREAMSAVAQMRTGIIEKARDCDYDYLFMVDTDMILHPLTLQTLIDADKDIIAELAWSVWSKASLLAPTAWDYNCYDFFPDVHTRIEELKVPGLHRVGMTGACTLLSKRVLHSGLNYLEIPNLKMWGEDRHFCIKAATLGFEIWVDSTYPPKHIYRETEWKSYGNE